MRERHEAVFSPVDDKRRTLHFSDVFEVVESVLQQQLADEAEVLRSHVEDRSEGRDEHQAGHWVLGCQTTGRTRAQRAAHEEHSVERHAALFVEVLEDDFCVFEDGLFGDAV